MMRKLAWGLAALLLPSLAEAQDTLVVTDGSILPGQTVTWTANRTYVLNGRVFVDNGATLNIQAGTVIKAMPGTGENASALIVARGGRIYARGTATQPIIFTALADDVTNPNDLPVDTRGLWGGVIILGMASLNSTPGQTSIEGIPTTETRGVYGGSNDDDNSGVFRYVSIRYGGSIIGANNEINGLTLGGVGRGTTVEYVEVMNNADDGFEFFGGTVNTRYLVSALNDDDAFDYDEGFRGKGQFWVAIQSAAYGDKAGEHDGGTTPEDGRPYAIPVIYNATYIGSGTTAANATSAGLILRDNAGGKYYSSIVTDFVGRGLNIEDDATAVEDSRRRLEQGDIVFANNIWWGFGSGATTLETVSSQSYTRDHLTANGNRLVDPLLTSVVRTPYLGTLDLRPRPGSPALTGAAARSSDRWYTYAPYVGAFGATNWMAGWTALCPVNHAPVLAGPILDQTLTARAAATVIPLSAWATDADGDVLTYMASSSRPAVVAVAISGSQLRLTPKATGTTSINLRTSDGKGNAGVSQRFTVTVRAAKEASDGSESQELGLEQNHPNPFNPSTSVTFSLPAEGSVRLAVFDLLGQQVASLVDGTLAAGLHQVSFDASHLATGIYVYRLETPAGAITRRMTLMR
ncbi:MAG: T9SS type A sorting domain-containing protein [Candidatus Latescibacterota bacterium]|jgi:hypothetical protein